MQGISLYKDTSQIDTLTANSASYPQWKWNEQWCCEVGSQLWIKCVDGEL